MAEENFILTFSCLVVVVIIFFIIFIKSPPPQKPSQPEVQKKLRQAKAKTNYKEFVALKRQSAIKNYENYLSYQQRLGRQQKVRRIGRQARQVFGEAFPEFESPTDRGAFIRGIVLELVSRIYQGQSGLSPEWQKKYDEVRRNTQGNYACRQQAAAWFYEQKKDIEVRLAAGEISQEHYEDELEQLQQIYDELLQELNI